MTPKYNAASGIITGVLLTAFKLSPEYTGRILGSFFKGVYLPQNSDLGPPLERERNSVQKHVPSYLVEISPELFVLAAPTLL